MFSVGVRCVSQGPSTREANSYFFEEDMASAFGEDPFLPVVSINCFAFLASNISAMCAHRTRLTFRVQLTNNSMALLVTD